MGLTLVGMAQGAGALAEVPLGMHPLAAAPHLTEAAGGTAAAAAEAEAARLGEAGAGLG
jgi:hypothetical protein